MESDQLSDQNQFASSDRVNQKPPNRPNDSLSHDGIEADSDLDLSPEAIEASKSHVTEWNALVSTTNWEKGKIISQWRRERLEAGADVREYSDEAWSRLVNDVTAQHVGRLRRTFQRYGDSFTKYKGLFWSHFYATIDWEDAEMWLEGAVQNKWSVSTMRHQRWETLGKVESDRPRESDIVTAEVDEGLYVAQGSEDMSAAKEKFTTEPLREGPDFGDGDEAVHTAENVVANPDQSTVGDRIDPVRPFANLPDLPVDVMDALESFKLAIVRLKMSEWDECEPDDLLHALDALKVLVNAPA